MWGYYSPTNFDTILSLIAVIFQGLTLYYIIKADKHITTDANKSHTYWFNNL